MPLPPDFHFTQANLQDYVECRRRFQLRWLLALSWPAVAAEPADAYEATVRDGETFHRLIHQHQLGLPVEQLTAQALGAASASAAGEGLLAWWQNYLAAAPADLPPARHPEITLTAPVGDQRLVAKYDLVAVEPGARAVIVDWKTSARRTPRAALAGRLQTRVYRYVLAEAGAGLNAGQPIRPEQITMLYWFATFPDQPERLRYDATTHAADAHYLASLVAEIAAAGEDGFPLTTDETRCRFCPYRSLCGRGVEAGQMDDEAEGEIEAEVEAKADWANAFDFEQVAEVAF